VTSPSGFSSVKAADRGASQPPVRKEPTISICVTTHARPELLRQALTSAGEQTHSPTEIVVSDNVGDEATAKVIETFSTAGKIRVRHVFCPDPGAVENANHAIRAATSELIVLLHDDDLFYPGALFALVQPFLEVPGLVAAYGKEVVISDQGEELEQRSERRNRYFRRTLQEAGVRKDPMRAAILQQFPSDGYMVLASVAKAVLYRHEYGSARDVEFGIRCALHGPFYFVPVPVTKYRLSAVSVSRGPNRKADDACYQFVRLCLRLLHSHPAYRQEIEQRLRERIGGGISQAMHLGNFDEAFSWMVGRYYRHQLLTFRGAARALYAAKLACEAFARSRLGGLGRPVHPTPSPDYGVNSTTK
jgi:glycosyltransferase involved in cell wall biosynthesis